MNLSRLTTCLVAASLLLAGSAFAAGDPSKMTAAQISACMNNNLVNRGALRDITVVPTDREGNTRTLKMRFFWKPKGGAPRINLQLLEPLALKGSGYLMLINSGSEEVYFYFPGADRPLQVTGKNMAEPLWGTDVSYAEIKQVLGLLGSGAMQRVADSQVAGRPVFVLETTGKADEFGYDKVVSYVDQQGCVLLKSEFFSKPGKARKVLEADVSSLLTADKYWLVLKYTMRDLREETQTVVNMSDFSLEENIPERMFDPKRFFEPYK